LELKRCAASARTHEQKFKLSNRNNLVWRERIRANLLRARLQIESRFMRRKTSDCSQGSGNEQLDVQVAGQARFING